MEGEVEGEMGEFFQGLTIPHLSEEDKALLDSANHKTPGPDGLPNEVYKEYGDIMLPELLQVLNEAKENKKLPVSMTEATIIIPKEGKGSFQPTSYRLTSLLCAGKKISR